MSPVARLFLLLFVLARSPAGGLPAVTAAPAAGSESNPFAWSATTQEIATEAMGRLVTFAFTVTNRSSSAAAILATHSSCECTVAELPSLPWKFEPGSTGTLHVRMNIVGRFGLVSQTVVVETSHGRQDLVVRARIPLTPAPFNVPPRQMDLAAARKDPQAIFRNGCAACHALPAIGRQGGELFQKACAICHDSERRADFVPNLAALRTRRDAAYWRDIIEHGKPGTLMPAFARAQGGLLEPAQVESLVEYLVRTFPAREAPPGARP